MRNYECLATLKQNMRNVYIDEDWVVNQYLMMEQKKSWGDLDHEDDMLVLDLERQMLAESIGVDPETLLENEDEITETEVIEIMDNST